MSIANEDVLAEDTIEDLIEEIRALREQVRQKNVLLAQKDATISDLQSQLSRTRRAIVDYVPEHDYDDR